MSFLQRVIAWFVSPETFGEMKAESEQWFLTCPNCGYKKSAWELGGIRYKAQSVGKVRLLTCPQCKEKSWFKWIKI